MAKATTPLSSDNDGKVRVEESILTTRSLTRLSCRHPMMIIIPPTVHDPELQNGVLANHTDAPRAADRGISETSSIIGNIGTTLTPQQWSWIQYCDTRVSHTERGNHGYV